MLELARVPSGARQAGRWGGDRLGGHRRLRRPTARITGPAGVTIRSGLQGELAALTAVADDAALTLSEAGLLQSGQSCVTLPRLASCHAEGLLWTAVDGAGRQLGFVAATIADDNLHIVAIAVARAHQRRSIGSVLMKRAIDHGRWAFFPTITLTADAVAPFGAPFYRRLGFVALALERLPPDLAAFLRSECAALSSRVERIAMAKVL